MSAANKLVPQLRFPEFQNTEAWEKVTVAEAVKTISPPKKLQTNQYDQAGSYPVIDQSPHTICGWTDDEDAVIRKPLPMVVFGDHTCVIKRADAPFAQGADGIKLLVARNGFDTDFLYQLLCSRPLKSESYKRHFTKLKLVETPKPRIPAEQRKIADCLGSLDDRIAAEGRKLAELREHKKGLMQQLFPSEGETQPRLRFPEFQNAGKWGVEPLGRVVQFVKSKIPVGQMEIDDYVSTENLLPEYGGIQRATKLPPSGSATHYKPDDILIANIRPYLKKVWRANKSGGASNDVIVIRSTSKLSQNFLRHVIANDKFINFVMKTAKGVKMPRGDIVSIKEYNVYIPSPAEQQSIAECLSVLDTLIAAQAEKIEALRLHKRGLMQQLFPSSDTMDQI